MTIEFLDTITLYEARFIAENAPEGYEPATVEVDGDSKLVYVRHGDKEPLVFIAEGF